MSDHNAIDPELIENIDALKQLAGQFRALTAVADRLDGIRSIQNAANEAEQRLGSARDAEAHLASVEAKIVEREAALSATVAAARESERQQLAAIEASISEKQADLASVEQQVAARREDLAGLEQRIAAVQQHAASLLG